MAKINKRSNGLGYTVYFGQWFGTFSNLTAAMVHCENMGWEFKLNLSE